MEQAMQAMRMAFDVLDTVTISTAEVDKMYTVRNELRRAYAILAQEVERARFEQNANSGKEETDGGQDDQ
jgi:type II secretory pathway component PulJ